MATKQELVAALAQRYRAAGRHEKARILDEFIAVTGYHRKHAVRLMGRAGASAESGPARAGRRVYDEPVRQALEAVWEAADRICGKRLKVVLPVFLEALEAHGRLTIDDSVRQRLLAISPATIDRLLRTSRESTEAGKRREDNQH